MKLKGTRGTQPVPLPRISSGLYWRRRQDGLAYASKRPTQPYDKRDNAEFNRQQLAYSAYLANTHIDLEYAEAHQWSRNSNDTWKDVLTRAQFGTLYKITLADGTEYHPADHSYNAPADPIGTMAGYTLIQFTPFVTGVPQSLVDCVLPSDINELLVIHRNIGTSVTAQRILRCSVDAGVSYFASTADYRFWPTTGVEASISGFCAACASSTSQQSGVHYIPNLTPGAGPPINMNCVAAGLSGMFIGSTNPVNAVRFIATPTANLTGTTNTSYIVFLGR